MKRLLIVATIFFLGQQAHATTIEAVADPTHPTIIVIREHFDRDSSGSDIRAFELHAAEHKNAIVFLDSPGGSMQTGLRIDHHPAMPKSSSAQSVFLLPEPSLWCIELKKWPT